MATPKRKTTKKTTQYSDLDRRWSILLFGIGAFVVLLSFIPGEAGWAWLRANILFGTFGVGGWFVGPLLIFLAVMVSLSRPVLGWVIRGVLFLLALSGVALVFGSVNFTGLSFFSILKALHADGAAIGFSGGLLSLVFGWTLLTAFGRVAARVVTILILIVAVMLLTKVTPADIGRFVLGLWDRWRAGGEGRQARRAEREYRREERRLRQEQEARYQEEYYEEEEVLYRPAAALRRNRAVDISLGPDATASSPGVPHSGAKPFTDTPDVNIGPGGTFGMNPLGEGELFGKNGVNAGPAKSQSDFGVGSDEDNWLKNGTAADDDPIEPFPISRPRPQPFAGEEPLKPFDPTSDESLFDAEGEGNVLLFGEDDPYAPLGGAESRLPRGTLVDVEYVAPFAAGAAEPPPAPEFDLFGRSTAAPEPVQFPYHQPSEEHFSSSMEKAGAPLNAAPDPADPAAHGVHIPEIPPPPGAPGGMPGAPGGMPGAPGGMPGAPAGTTGAAIQVAAGATVGAAAGAAAAAAGDGDAPSVDALIDKAAAPKASTELGEPQPEEDIFQPYEHPPASLFAAQAAENNAGAREEMKKTADLLVSTLESFGVQTRILDVCRGPSVTRYEIQPQAGVKISRITNLSDDIALNLAAAGVRIEAPIPGKPAVGIEVPNRRKTPVAIRGILESRAFTEEPSPLAIALGKDIAGENIVADLTRMPHLLIAGSTGSGKSVCINATIMSLLYRSSPEEVQMILIDPKVVELAEYNGIPHLMMPVVTEPKKAAQALGNAVNKMEQRYHLFAEHGVRDIASFNKLASRRLDMEKLPYIAIVIDELADLMMVAGKDVENYICRLAQKARAAGMHLIVATQRPSVDVITGLIKANIPSRIAFAVSSQVDSRTILDGGGAEKLLGMGDMLYMPIGASKPVRVQGTFVQDREISAVLRFIKRNNAPQYDEGFIEEMQSIVLSGSAGAPEDPGEGDVDMLKDPTFQSAVEMALENGQISTSHIQRRLRLGYARAGRIVDEMERLHIVGEPNGSKPRELLITRQQWLEMSMNAED